MKEERVEFDPTDDNFMRQTLSSYPTVIRALGQTGLTINIVNSFALLFIAVRSLLRLGYPPDHLVNVFALYLEAPFELDKGSDTSHGGSGKSD